jgi:Ca2+-binding RTX toxin-like protein
MSIINGTPGDDRGSEGLYGTPNDDSIFGFGGNDELSGAQGNDYLDGGDGGDHLGQIGGGLGDDTMLGGSGDDLIETNDPGDDYIDGGAGNDFFGHGVLGNDTVLGGDGDDFFSLFGSGLLGLGAGQDTVWLGNGGPGGPSAVVITDFAAGDGGDVLDLSLAVNSFASQGYQGGNPFNASQGFLRLEQSGSDLLLQQDVDGLAGGNWTWETLVVLRNTSAGSLTAFNFDGIPPDGSDVPGETVTGGNADDFIAGGFFDDSLSGGNGNDTIEGSGGGDTLRGSLGNDLLVGGPGNDLLFGGNGDDTIVVDVIPGEVSSATGGAGSDVYAFRTTFFDLNSQLSVSVGDFSVAEDRIDVDALLQYSADFGGGYTGGNPFALSYLRLVDNGTGTELQWDRDGTIGGFGGAGEWQTVLTLIGVDPDSLDSDNFVAGFRPDGTDPAGLNLSGTDSANDLLTGSYVGDTLAGAGGNDTIHAGIGNDTIDGGNGEDWLFGGLGNDTIVGGNGRDALRGDGGDDWLLGGPGDYDNIADSSGSNFLGGGAGNDVIFVDSFTGSNTVNGGAGEDTFSYGGLLGYVGTYVHTVLDFVAGSAAGPDLLDVDGLLGSSTGYTGGNYFSLGYLALVPEGGNTLLQYDPDGAAGGGFTLTTGLRILNVTPGQFTSDNFVGQLAIGTEGDDSLATGPGNDTIVGLGGNDTLDGSSGRDSMEGGSGNDVYRVDDPGDAVVEPEVEIAEGAQAIIGLNGVTDTVIATISYSLANVASVENLVLEGAAVSGTGNAFANELVGNALANVLSGLEASDSILGGEGNDTLQGNQGSDTLRGGVGDDELRGGQDGDVIYSGQGADQVLGAFGDDELRGGLGNDTVSGGQGNDSLFGGADSDLLQGRLGNDTVTGGAGADMFWFNAAGAADADLIVDFQADDVIALDAAFFTAQTFGVNVIYDAGTGELSYDADGAGGSAALLIATLQGTPALSGQDIAVM